MGERRKLNKEEMEKLVNDFIAKDYNPTNTYVKNLELMLGCNEEGPYDSIKFSFVTYDSNNKFEKDIHVDFGLDDSYMSIKDHYNDDKVYFYSLCGIHDTMSEEIKKICMAYDEDLHIKSEQDFQKIFFDSFYSSLKEAYEITFEIREDKNNADIENITEFNNEIEKEELKKSIIHELFSKDMADFMCKDINGIDKGKNEFWIDIISKSLLDIYKKYEYAKKLGLEKLAEECKIVIDSLEPEYCEILYLKKVFLNSDVEGKGIKPFEFYKDVRNYIESEIDNEIKDEENSESRVFSYYKLEKWIDDNEYCRKYYIRGPKSNMILDYVYYIINGKIVYASRKNYFNGGESLKYLNLPKDFYLPMDLKI